MAFFCQYSAHRAPTVANYYRNAAPPQQKVLVMDGGFRGWEAMELPITKVEEADEKWNAHALKEGAAVASMAGGRRSQSCSEFREGANVVPKKLLQDLAHFLWQNCGADDRFAARLEALRRQMRVTSTARRHRKVHHVGQLSRYRMVTFSVEGKGVCHQLLSKVWRVLGPRP